jgi:hypothetical protein
MPGGNQLVIHAVSLCPHGSAGSFRCASRGRADPSSPARRTVHAPALLPRYACPASWTPDRGRIRSSRRPSCVERPGALRFRRTFSAWQPRQRGSFSGSFRPSGARCAWPHRSKARRMPARAYPSPPTWNIRSAARGFRFHPVREPWQAGRSAGAGAVILRRSESARMSDGQNRSQ